MKKPELNDYNLTKADLENYENQKKKCARMDKILQQECDDYNRKIKIGVFIFVAFYIILCLLYYFPKDEDIDVFTIVFAWLIFPFIITIICGYVDYKKDANTDWMEIIMASVCLSVIGMGIYIYVCFERKAIVDKYKYIDKNLEDRINSYY